MVIEAFSELAKTMRKGDWDDAPDTADDEELDPVKVDIMFLNNPLRNGQIAVAPSAAGIQFFFDNLTTLVSHDYVYQAIELSKSLRKQPDPDVVIEQFRCWEQLERKDKGEYGFLARHASSYAAKLSSEGHLSPTVPKPAAGPSPAQRQPR